jgi:predicted transcriptional regulator of viral defense system
MRNWQRRKSEIWQWLLRYLQRIAMPLFRLVRYIIDTLKQTVPIWKKEIFEGGEVWVAAHP